MKKTLKKLLIASIAAGSFIFTPSVENFNFFSTVQAEVKTYTGVGKCIQSELVTAAQAKNYARLRAELNAKEQAGVYVVSYYRMQNSTLTENEVSLITNSIINVVGDVNYEHKPFQQDGVPAILYTATLQANIDSDGITAYIQRQNEQRNKDGGRGSESQIQFADKEIKDNLDKIDNLIERYNRATTQSEKNKIRAEFSQSDRQVLAGQKLEEGNEFYYKGDYEKAIELYSEALAFNPNYDWAYNNRGIAYIDLEQYEQAISDLNRAIELNPNYANACYNRGIAYSSLKQYKAAISDYKKAIEINPNLSEAYIRLDIACQNLNQYEYEAAISGYNKAIQLNPNYVEAYNNRGIAYSNLKQYEAAISDFNKAIQLDPIFVEHIYNNRGDVYKNLKQYEAAISDYSKAIELKLNSARAYNNRGICYQALGEIEKAEADFAKAKELGYKE